MKREAWHEKLAKATEWLLGLVDAETGQVPNLGPNDGAYILPFANLPFADYRPVLQAAARTFLGENAFGTGSWNEMELWLNTGKKGQGVGMHSQPSPPNSQLPTLHAPHSWAYLRAAQFHDRPGHADQLHLDLWWRGLNVAQDAGTYLYNAEPPWDNALTHNAVHNTVMIDGLEQMTPAGKFLYLDRAQAKIAARERAKDGSWQRMTAQHDGYQKLGIIHHRTVTVHQNDHWRIEDQIFAPTIHRTLHSTRLHWLLPNWEWQLNGEWGIGNWELGILSPHGWVSIQIQAQTETNPQPSTPNPQLVLAGELIHGSGYISPTWGWVSPTYGVKIPALSVSVTVESQLPIKFLTAWSFPDE